jgi:hypothetical protein
MARIRLCMASGDDLGRVEEIVRTVQLMIPRIELQFLVDADGRTVHFTCQGVEVVTIESAVLMLKTLLSEIGNVK